MNELAKVKKDLLEEIKILVIVVDKIQHISLNQAGIKTDGRRIRAIKISTRQTLSAISLLKLLSLNKDEDEIWDISSFASITRNIIECFINLHYFGTESISESISESEAELRFFLLQYHRNKEWFNIRKRNFEQSEYEQFEKGLKEEKERLKDHPYLDFLDTNERNKVLRGYEIYKSKAFFKANLIVCSNLREH